MNEIRPPQKVSLTDSLRRSFVEAILKVHLIVVAEHFSDGEVTREDIESFSRGDFVSTDAWRHMNRAMHRYADYVCDKYQRSVLSKMSTIGDIHYD